jgi:hypothetical protein
MKYSGNFSAISNQQSAISNQQSAISNQLFLLDLSKRLRVPSLLVLSHSTLLSHGSLSHHQQSAISQLFKF